MIYFYGSKEQASGKRVDCFASTAHKDAIGDATLVYTDDEVIKNNYTAFGIKVLPITEEKPKPKAKAKTTEK